MILLAQVTNNSICRLCMFLTLSQLGPAALTGFAFFLLMAPISSFIASRQFKIRGLSMKITDQRSKILLEALSTSNNILSQ